MGLPMTIVKTLTVFPVALNSSPHMLHIPRSRVSVCKIAASMTSVPLSADKILCQVVYVPRFYAVT
jgi:hypothetical protein